MHDVVDELLSELAERRRVTIGRRAAYLGLARAILSDDESDSLDSERNAAAEESTQAA